MINRPSVYIVLWLVSVVGLSIGSVFYPWMYYYPYGETVTLKPLFKNDSDAKVTITKCKWISPDRIIFDPDAPTYETNKHYVDKAKCELTIFNIQKDTDGIYHCIVNDKFISKALLNVHGAPKQSTLEEYTPNLIAGFSTAGGIIAFFAFTCAVYRFRYQSPVKMEKTGEIIGNANGEKKTKMTAHTQQPLHVANDNSKKNYVNENFQDDEDDLRSVRF